MAVSLIEETAAGNLFKTRSIIPVRIDLWIQKSKDLSKHEGFCEGIFDALNPAALSIPANAGVQSLEIP
jgi:hypothetical protein